MVLAASERMQYVVAKSTDMKAGLSGLLRLSETGASHSLIDSLSQIIWFLCWQLWVHQVDQRGGQEQVVMEVRKKKQ